MTATPPMTDADLDAMEARANAATEGPWDVVPRTDDSMLEVGEECQYCDEGRPLVSSEDFRDDDGVLSHTLHRHAAEPHHIVAGEAEVTGAVDWEEGGIIRGADVMFIAHARMEHPALITEMRALRAQLREAQDDAWKRGYDACKTGEQRHSPYRAVKLPEGSEAPNDHS